MAVDYKFNGVVDYLKATEIPDYYYDEKAATRVVNFIERYCTHVKGRLQGRPVMLEDWQKHFVKNAFGWKVKRTGLRKHKFIYLEIPKKNGKSTLLSCISLYLLCADREPGAEIYSVAGDTKQAAIVFEAAKKMIKQNPKLEAILKPYRYSILHPKSSSEYHILSADAETKHGFNIHGLAFDELHVQKNRKLFDTLVYGIAARTQPIVFMITTAGLQKSFAEQQHDYAKGVIAGTIEDPDWYARIYAADPKDDPFSPSTWEKANPGYGDILTADYFHMMARKAKKYPSELNSFKQLHLNIWTGSSQAWIPPHVYRKGDVGILPDSELLAGQCWAGIDLASTKDLCAFSLYWELERNNKYYSRTWTFCPEDTIEDRMLKENVNYLKWIKEGWIIPTPGNVQDMEFIKDFVVEKYYKYKFLRLGADPWNADNFLAYLNNKYGMDVMKIFQVPKYLSPAAKLIEKQISNKNPKYFHDGNPAMEWMLGNVEMKRDNNGNIKPDRDKSKGKIDGVLSLLDAVSTMQKYREDNPNDFDPKNFMAWG